MATSSVMQSILATPGTRVINASASYGQLVSAYSLPRYHRNATLRVNCTAEGQDGETEGTKPSTSPNLNTTPTPTPTPRPVPPPAPKVSTKFSDVLAFSGPAPERINGRLAMIGFVSAMAVELSNGQDVLTQVSNGGAGLFVAASVVLTAASLVPLLKGVSVQSYSSGIMTSDAEMWNGRFAMLGLVALAFTEYVKGSALV